MKNGYKKQITEQIKAPVNQWIDDLKGKHQDLLLTRQWQIIFPRGFHSGFNILPVVTSGKQGKHLIAEVQFVLPDDLELDPTQLELVLKNEPYLEKDKENPIKNKPVPLTDTFDLLNDIVLGLNSFLQHTNIQVPTHAPPSLNVFGQQENKDKINPIKINNDVKADNNVIKNGSTNDTGIDNIRREMLNSPFLPDWIKTINSREVYHGLLDKLAQAYAHYQNQLGRSNVNLKSFFDKYTEHLLAQHKLHHYCKYKSQPISLDDNGFCTESYCSKKPYRAACPFATTKFG